MLIGGSTSDEDQRFRHRRRKPQLTAHHFTVDVEEYFQVSAFAPSIARAHWEQLESRVAASVSQVLELLETHDAKGTFFVLGWVAERQPEMVRSIAAAGHEVASHGWDHVRVSQQEPDEFRASIRESKRLLEELSGQRVVGFRAPSFSILPGGEWALDVLIEEGYEYDSSLYPVRRPGYGYPNGRWDPHWLARPAGRLAEVPPSTLRRWGLKIPAGGGAYFRVLPYGLVRATLRQYERQGVPATFYIHPWELDPGQPRLDVGWVARLRHYSGLRRTKARLDRLLREFRFTSIAETIASL